MKHYTQTPVSARLTFSRSSLDNKVHPTLAIEDRISGTRIIDIDMTADDLANMLAGSGPTVLANVLTGSTYAERIGSRIEVTTVAPSEWPEGWTVRNPSSRDIDLGLREATGEMNNFGLSAMIERGYQEFFWSLHNYGWSLTLRRWSPVTEFDRVEMFEGGRYL